MQKVALAQAAKLQAEFLKQKTKNLNLSLASRTQSGGSLSVSWALLIGWVWLVRLKRNLSTEYAKSSKERATDITGCDNVESWRPLVSWASATPTLSAMGLVRNRSGIQTRWDGSVDQWHLLFIDLLERDTLYTALVWMWIASSYSCNTKSIVAYRHKSLLST